MTPRLSMAIGIAILLLPQQAFSGFTSSAPTCGATVTGKVALKTDLACPTGHGLVVGSGATLNCNGHHITGQNQLGQYGIYVRDGAKTVVRNCVVEAFEVGIRVRAATRATVRDSVVRDNLRYGVEITQESVAALILSNQILSNGDEGVHVSGPVGRDASHRIVDNTIDGNAAEGIYLLRSSGSLIARNTISNHGAAGIYVKGSARNAIEENILINDPLHLVYGSQENVLADNTIVGQQIRFKDASNNRVSALRVQGEGGRPSVAYEFERSSGNLIANSEALDSADYDIRAESGSTDNVFTRFTVPATLDCSVDETSSVSVTDRHGATVTCGR